MSGINRINSGSTLPLSTNFSVGRQTPDMSFGKRIQAGVSATGSVVGSGLGIAGGSFSGGPAILSAAVSSAMTLGNHSSSGAVNTTYKGLVSSPSNAIGSSVTGGGSTIGAPSTDTTVANSMSAEAAQSGIDLNAQHAKNMELLGIQSALQQENLTFSSLSNTMKTRHDTAKNSIANLR
jgi:hypothetical protein